MRTYQRQIMDDGEIVIQYKLAKDKRKQIAVLSDLNGITKNQIKEILQKNGIDDIKPQGRTKSNAPVSFKNAPNKKLNAEEQEFYAECIKEAENGKIKLTGNELTKEETEYKHQREVEDLVKELEQKNYELNILNAKLMACERKAIDVMEYANAVARVILNGIGDEIDAKTKFKIIEMMISEYNVLTNARNKINSLGGVLSDR